MSENFQAAQRVVAADNHLGETPLWSIAEQALFWINCENPPQVHRWTPKTGVHDTWPMPERVGGIALAPRNKLLVVLSRGVYDFDPGSADLALRCASPLPDHVSLHECQCDRQGRPWVGSYDHNFSPANRDARQGALFRLQGSKLIRVIGNIGVANGLAFSPDGKSMYFADSAIRSIDSVDLDPVSGAISNRKTFLKLQEKEGFVDGATVDAQGGYWLAAVGAGALRRYLPDGRLDRIVELPVSNPTNAAFGGPDLGTLYITTTKLAIGRDSASNGGLYALSPGVVGLPEPILAE